MRWCTRRGGGGGGQGKAGKAVLPAAYSKYMESAWGQWLRKLGELHASDRGLDEDCREARQFVVAFRVPYQMFLGTVEAVAPALPAAAHDVTWPGVHSGGIEGAFSVHGAFCTLYNGLRV